MEIEIEKLRKNTGTISVKLREMPIGEQHAFFVDIIDAGSARTTISNIKSANSKFRFKTEKTEGGILVWRLPDAELTN